jgi:hypothetical protein
LIDAHDRAQLRAELTGLGIQFKETPQFWIDLNGRSSQQVLKSIETLLTFVKRHMLIICPQFFTAGRPGWLQ